MKDTFAIKENRLFRRAYYKGLHSYQRHIAVYVLKNQNEKDTVAKKSHLGITVSKKFGNSVQRNFFKRIVREVFREAQSDFGESYDVVVVARPSKRSAATPTRKLKAESLPTFSELRSEMYQAFYSLKIISFEK